MKDYKDFQSVTHLVGLFLLDEEEEGVSDNFVFWGGGPDEESSNGWEESGF